MDESKILPIRRHTTLLKRLPGTRFTNQMERKRANWIVFTEQLTPRYFEHIDLFTGFFNPIVDAWKVGQYEVALMSGNLTLEHETILQGLNLDYAALNEIPDLSVPGLIVFDMDSTAIQIECIDEVAKLAGVGEDVVEITEKAMQGKLDFEQSLLQRVGKLKGANESILAQVKNQLPFTPDFEALVATLQALNWKTAIASGGFTYFSDHIKDKVGLDFAKSNQLEIIDGKITGEILGEVVSAQTKADILLELAEEYDIEHHNTVAIGDGANDLAMMSAAGLGIAYHAKLAVEEQAQAAIRQVGLGGVLCILSASLIKQQKISWAPRPKLNR